MTDTAASAWHLSDEQIVTMILGEVTTDEYKRFAPSVIAIWRPRFVAAADHAAKVTRAEALEAAAGLKLGLQWLRAAKDGVDNGYCRLCQSHRLCDLEGNPRQCENEECLSRYLDNAQVAWDKFLEGN